MSNPKMNPKLGVIYLIMSPWSSKNQNENFAQICHHTINISFIFTTPWVHDPSPSHINSKKNLHGSMKATFTVERIETTVEIKGGFIVGWWPPLFRENKEIAALEAGLRSTSCTPRVWLRIVPLVLVQMHQAKILYVKSNSWSSVNIELNDLFISVFEL